MEIWKNVGGIDFGGRWGVPRVRCAIIMDYVGFGMMKSRKGELPKNGFNFVYFSFFKL